MPIRIGLQSAAVPRLHADWNASRQSPTTLLRSAQLTAERLVRSPFTWVLKVVADFRRRFSLRSRLRRRQQAMLRAFDDKYEQLVDLICWGAQSSSAASRQSAYGDLRNWMRDNYGAVRNQLQRCLVGQLGQTSRDPFEALLSFERLDDVLTAYSSIDDMMMCRKALDEYRRGLC